jgi:hypothetical protein
MSMPIALPAGPTICAAISRFVPAPQPKSTTVAPRSVRLSANGFRDAREALNAPVRHARNLGLR